MLALISAKKNNLSFEHVFNKEFKILKEPLLYSIMAGIMYSIYQLAWAGASLFAFIALGYAVFQYILNNLRKESSDYLGIIGITIFSLSTVLLLPSVHPEIGFDIYDYSWYPVFVTLGAMISFVFLSLVEKVYNTEKIKFLLLSSGNIWNWHPWVDSIKYTFPITLSHCNKRPGNCFLS